MSEPCLKTKLHVERIAQQTRYIEPMLVERCASVSDGRPVLGQHPLNASWLVCIERRTRFEPQYSCSPLSVDCHLHGHLNYISQFLQVAKISRSDKNLHQLPQIYPLSQRVWGKGRSLNCHLPLPRDFSAAQMKTNRNNGVSAITE